MYSITVPEPNSGKTLLEFLEVIAETDGFLQKFAAGFRQESCIVMLDNKIIPSPAQSSTIVNAGQSVKVFPLVFGG